MVEAMGLVRITEALIHDLAEAVVREAAPEMVILYGSCARGTATEDSDVDLMVVEEGPFGDGRPRFDEVNRIHRALSGFGVSVDVIVYTRDELEYWKETKNHIVKRALREGRILYDKHTSDEVNAQALTETSAATVFSIASCGCSRDQEHAVLLLNHAEKQLSALRHLAGSPKIAQETIGFYAEQVVENALKAWLASKSIEYPLKRPLEEFLDLVQSRGLRLPPAAEGLRVLTPYAAVYGGDLFELPEEPFHREEIVESVGTLFEYVKGLLQPLSED